MKVLILSHKYPVQKRPYQHIFVREEARLVSTFYDPYVVNCLSFKPSILFNKREVIDYKRDGFPIEPIVYFSIPRRRFSGITARMLEIKIGPILDRIMPDLIHAHFLYPSGLTVHQAKKRNIPFVVTIHGVDWYHNVKIPSLKKRIDRIIEAADKIICVGPKLESDVKKAYPEASEKIQTLLHGIDFNFFKPPAKRTSQKGKTNVLCVARFVHKKGLHLLVDAVSKSKVLKSDCSFTIVGDKTDKEYYNGIVKQIADKAVNNISIKEPVGKEELLSLYQQADFYVQPSLDEPFGLSLLEAIACGLPAVALSSGGPDVIINEQNGILVKSPEHLKNTVEKMSMDWTNYPYKQLHESVRNRFDSSIKRENLKHIYDTIT